MTEPENGSSERYSSEQAYSRALPLPNPRGPVAPEPIGGETPPPTPSSGRTAAVVLVAIAAIVAVVGAILFAATRGNSDAKDANPSNQAVEAPLFRANDCLYDVPEAPKVGNCDDGGSPYKVTQVMPPDQTCQPEQTSIAKGRRWYCLTPNLNVNYCYTTPVQGTWIKAAQRCGAPGTISVVSVVPGFKDPKRCRGDWDTNYTFNAPVYTICAKSYT